MSELKLIFYKEGRANPYMRINWPPAKQRLQAFLAADDNVAAVNTNFIVSNKPPGHNIYFVVGSPIFNEHVNMKQKLSALGGPFEEKVEAVGEATVGLFRRHRVEEKRYLLFGSTTRRDVIESLFNSYISWSGFSWPFIFFVATSEPRGWKEIVDILSVGNPYPPHLISESYCVMETTFEEGISIASIEVTPEQLNEVAARVAKELSLYLSLKSS